MFIKPVYAQITNPALPDKFGTDTGGGAGLAFYISQLWKTMVVVGALGFLLYLVWGGVEWVTSGGDKTKVQAAQQRITSALIGLTLLVASYAIIAFISEVLDINILNVDWTFS